MYVCLCRAVTDHQLDTAICQGINTRKKLFKCFGVGRDCGKCNKAVHDILLTHTHRHVCSPRCDRQAFSEKIPAADLRPHHCETELID